MVLCLRNDRNSTFWGDFYFGSWRSGTASGEQFKYFQFVLGNAIGLYSLLKTTHCITEWTWLLFMDILNVVWETYSYKTATIFLISRTIGSAFRLYLVVIVLQRFVFDLDPFCSYRIDFISFNICLYRGGLKPSSSLILYKHFLSHFCLYDYLFYLPKLKSQYYQEAWSR
jgi:hypothetical protein